MQMNILEQVQGMGNLLNITLAVRYFCRVGGMEKFTLALAEHLVAKGHDVKVLSIRGEGRPGLAMQELGAPTLVPRAARDWLTGRALARALRSREADIIYGEQKMWGCDVIRPSGGCEPEYWKQHVRYRGIVPRPGFWRHFALKHAFDINAEARGYRDDRLRRVLVNSVMVERELLRHYPHLEGRIEVVHEGVGLPEASEPLTRLERSRLLGQHGLDPTRPLALFVGHDFRRKGLREAIEALEMARRIEPTRRMQLLVIGRDGQKSCRRLARRLGVAQDVAFAGSLMPVDPYYRAADVLFLPTYYDPFANVTLEAMAWGLPVLTTRQNGGSEMIRPGENGWIVDSPGAIVGMAEVLVQIGRMDLAAQRACCRQTAREHPQADALARIESIFMAVAEEKRRGRGRPPGRSFDRQVQS